MNAPSVPETEVTGELLTLPEINRLQELEAVVETGLTVFVKVGNALLEIRDSRLYRQQYPTFEAYCRERWNLSRPRAYQLLEAAAVVGNLECLPMVDTITERQARPLTRLEPEVQQAVWREVVEETPAEQITAKVVEEKAKAAEPLNTAVKAIKDALKPEPRPPIQAPMIPEPVKPKDPAMTAAVEAVKAGQPVIEAAKAIQPQPSKADPAKMGYVAGAGNSERDSDDWHTPALYIEAVREVLGTIDLDPFSSEVANQTVQARRFFTIADDATRQGIWGFSPITVFMNPPYGRGVIDAAVKRFCVALDGISAAIVLVNNATETQWFQSLLNDCQAFCLVNHRIAFVSPDNKNESGGVRGQVFFYFGGDYQKFADRFKAFGPVCEVLS